MISDNYMINFIDTCIKSGKKSSDDICQEAIKRISEIDNQLEKIGALHLEKKHLKSVLRNFNFNKEKEQQKDEIVVDSISHTEFVESIKNLVNNSENSVTSRDIIHKICNGDISNTSKITAIYKAIQVLLNNNVLKRNEDRTLSVGEMFNINL